MKLSRRVLATLLIGFGVIVAASVAVALTLDTKQWTFDVASDYTYDANRIQIASGYASLKEAQRLDTASSAVGFNGSLSNISFVTDHLELTPPSAVVDMAAGLRFLYHFDEASGETILDDTCAVAPGCFNIPPANNGNLGSFGAGDAREPARVPGRIVKALSFDGVDDYAIAGPAGTMPQDNWTLEAWIYYDGTPIPPGTFGKGLVTLADVTLANGGSGQGYGLWLGGCGGVAINSIDVWYFIGVVAAPQCSNVPLDINTWTHVAAVRRNGILELYKNGIRVGPDTSPADGVIDDLDGSVIPGAPLSTTPLCIGAGNMFGTCGGTAPFKGMIDEVGVYNQALAPAVIVSHATRPSSGTYTSPVISDPLGIVKKWRNLSWVSQPANMGGSPLPADTSGLQGLWHFDNTPNDAVCAAGGTCTNTTADHGTPSGAAYTTSGKFNTAALQLSGSGYVSLPDNASLRPSALSVEMWVKPTAVGTKQYFISRQSGNASYDAYGLFMDIGNQWTFWMTNASNQIMGTTIVVPQVSGQWYHVAGTYDQASGSCPNIYVNGVQGTVRAAGTTGCWAGVPGYASAQLPYIGQKFSGINRFNGTIDEVAFYNTALSLSTIQAHAGGMSLRFKVRTGPCSDPTNGACAPQWTTWQPLPKELSASQTSLKALWHLNEAAGASAADSVNGGSNATADSLAFPGGTLSPAWDTVSPRLGASALQFNGSTQYVTAADSAELKPSTQITVEGWVKFNALGATSQYLVFKQNTRSTDPDEAYALYKDGSNMLSFRVVSSGGTPVTAADTIPVVTGTWYHVAGTYEGSTARLYVNGVLRASTAVFSALNHTTQPLYLGRDNGSAAFLNGWLDDVAIYSTALPDATLAQHYQDAQEQYFTTAGDITGLVTDNLYAQYQALLDSTIPMQTPELDSVTFEGRNYPMDNPTIVNTKTGDPTSAPVYAVLGTFTNPTAIPATSATITYQLSPNGTDWYYYNGTNWVPAAVGQSNPVGVVNTAFAQFVTDVTPILTGSGGLRWKAFLSSNGLVGALLNQVDATYKNAKLTLASPVGGEKWLVGTTHSITWSCLPGFVPTAGTIQNVKLEYSNNNGSNWQTLPGGASTPNDGQFDWTIAEPVSTSGNPDQPSSVIRISGADVGSETVIHTSPLAFTVSQLDLTAPLLNETKLLGSTYAVTWNTSATNPGKTVKLEYSQDDGTTWSTLPGAAALPSTPTSFSWTVDPATPVSTTPGSSNPGQGKSLLRISYVAAPGELRSSPHFTVSRLDVTAPVLNETRLLGLPYPITWNTSAAVASLVTLTYSPDNGNNWSAIPGATSIANNGNFSWTVDPATAVSSAPGSPNPLQGKSLVRISYDAAATEVKDSPNFTVTKLQLTGPTSADTWLVGNTYAVTWATTASAGELVKLEYSPDSGMSWQTIPGGASAPNTGTFSWTVDPTTPVSTTPGNSNPGQGKSLIRVSFVNDAAAKTLSQPFTMTQFAVTSPAQSDLWRLGKIHSVTWTTTAPSLSSVKIDYSPSGTFTDTLPVVASAPSAGGASSYAWTLPVNLAYLSTATDTGRIRVAGLNGLGALVNDSASFTITRPFIQITAPERGQVVAVGSVQPITWVKQGTIGDKLKFEYSTNGFADETQTVCFLNCGSPASAIPTFSPYSWVVPAAAASPAVKLRLSDLIIPEGFGMSESFKVAGGLTVAVPVAGQTWAVGKAHTIQWTSKGQITSVKILLSTDNGNSFPTVVASGVPNGPGGGSVAWTPQPGDASTTAVIRVEDAADPQVFAASAVFGVTAVAVTSPAAGDQWLVGSAQAITWTQTGLTNARIEYSTDNGITFPNLITASTPAASGSFNWTVADTVKNDAVVIRLQDADQAGESRAEGQSAPFTIYGQLALTSPVGGESWSSGQSHPMAWSTPVGTIPNVTLEYSIDGFICQPMSNCGVIAASVANTGSYLWTPTFTSTTVKVRVSDAQNAQTQDSSPAFFEVTGIAIQQPVGGEVWTVGSTNKTIRWNFTGSFTKVKLEYSTDDFVNATLIEDNVLNTGTYTWALIPDAISSNVKIRITPTDDPSLYSISNAVTVQGVLQITAPNGGETFDVASSQQIRWNATGSMLTVKLQLSTNGGSSPWTDIATVTGALGSGTNPVANSYSWTVPDAISSQARVRVVDAVAGHPASADDSDANFAIRAFLSVVAPVTNDMWAVNETHQITWTTLGTVDTVIFEYSVEGAPFAPFGVAPNCATPDGQTSCSMNWTVPNLVPTPQSDPDVMVKVRIKDASAAHPAALAVSPDFLVKWYKITWHILDSENNNHLGGLNVSDVSSVPNWNGWTVANNSLTSTQAGTLFRYYPGGTFDTAWSRTGYFSGSASGWAADADKTITVYLDSETADQVEFHVHAESAYDATTDTLSFKTWLEKRGLLVGTSVADLARLGGSTVEVYDGTTLRTTLTDPTPDSKGQYEFTWPATGLTGGTVYFATASVIYPNQPVPGVTRTSGGVVNISIPKQIDNISTATGANGVTLNQLQTELQPISAAVVGDATTPPTLQTAIQADTQAAVSSSEGVITQAVGGVQTTADHISTATVGQGSTLEQVKTDTAAISTATVGAASTLEQVQTDTGAIKSDVQMVLVPQANATKADTAAIKTATVGADSTLEQVKVDTVAIKADTADIRPKVSAILSDPNVGLPKVQQTITDQTATMQDQFKSMRRGAIMTRDGAVEKGETPTISYRSEGGSPTVDVYNAISGARVLGPVPMPLNPATGLYDFTMDTTALPGGEYKVMVNEPSSPTSGGTIDSIIMTVRDPALRTAQNTSDVTQAIAALDTKVTTVLSQLDTLAAKADSIQATTSATKTTTDQLTVGVKTLTDGWGTQTLAQVTEQLDALSAKVGSPAQAADTNTLVSQLAKLQELVQSSQGSAASVGYAQSAMSAAMESVELIKQVQQTLGASALPPTAPAQLAQLQESLTRIAQVISVLPEKVASEDMGQQVAQLTEQIKALASEKGYAFDSLYEMSADQTKDVKAVRNRVEELKAVLDVQQSILENRVNEPVVKTWFESN